MRTSRSTVYLLILFVYLCCFVQQCHVLMPTLLANSVTSALTMTSAMGLTMIQSLMQSFVSTFAHGFSTLHTMAMSLISGFVMGNLFLAGFIFLLLAIAPTEEYRSLGGPGVFNSPLFLRPHHLLPYLPAENFTELEKSFPSNATTLARTKRSVFPLVNSTTAINATSLSFKLPLNDSATGRAHEYNLRFGPGDEDSVDLFSLNGNDSRIPRFLTRLVQSDPLNCLPLLLCGLSAARRPSERTEVLNDYAYVLKEFLEPDDEDKSNDRSSPEDDLENNDRYRQSPVNLLNKLMAGKAKKKKKDEVDEIIDELRKEEDDKIEDLVLTEMADDPSDIKYALEDMKMRGLKKTVSKMPHESKKEYISKLMMRDESGEEEEGEMIDDGYDLDEIPMHLLGHYSRHEAPDSGSDETDKRYYFDKRDLVKGRFPPAPPAPPVPEYGVGDDFLYKKNLKILESSLREGPPMLNRRRMPGGPPPFRGKRNGKEARIKGLPQLPHGFLQKKRGEAAAADNIFDKARVGSEVGALTRNNRQCRALFNECPVNSLVRPSADGDNNAPFLNRAVQNLRRVLFGTPPGGSKQRRVNEIREVIQQLHPPTHHGGSEVKVVLNIGPTPLPLDLHRAGGSPPPPPHQFGVLPSGLPAPIATNPVPHNDYSHQYDSFKNPAPQMAKRPSMPTSSTSKPVSSTTRKAMNYQKPTKNFSDLAVLLKTTASSMGSDEDSTTDMPQEETTVVFADNYDSKEMEDEPVLPTQYPMSKEEYAQNLRETFDIFKRFKEANKSPATTVKTTVRPRSTTTKKSAVQQSGTKKKSPVTKPGDVEQKDIDDDDDDDESKETGLQAIFNFIKKFREKAKDRKKERKKRKKNKKRRKKKPVLSSEESSEEEFGPDPHHNPTLVAVPPPKVRQQITWKSGTDLIKGKVYHLLFGDREVKPLPKVIPLHFPSSSSESGEIHHNKPIRHDYDVHHYQPPAPLPPVQHYHRLRTSGGDEEEEYENDPELTTIPSTSTSTSPSSGGSTFRPGKAKKKSKPPVITPRPIKIKLKKPTPFTLPESEEEVDFPRFALPPPPPPPPPHLLHHYPPKYVMDSSGSFEEEDDDDNSSVGPTRPQLLYTPFTSGRSRLKPFSAPKVKNSNKSKQKGANSSGRSISRTSTGSKTKSFSKGKKINTTAATTKPKRKILKYKNG